MSSLDFARAALAERRPPFFLTLAPAISASYPRRPASRPSGAEGNAVEATQPAALSRRRSSSSSTTGFRVLKLGPVYWGEHVDDHKDDFHDVVPASPPSPAVETSRPSTFLSLTPTTSASYPQMPVSRPSAATGNAIETAQRGMASRRTSSSSTGFRVLKLGPVYWGEHADDHKGDFHDIVPVSP